MDRLRHLPLINQRVFPILRIEIERPQLSSTISQKDLQISFKRQIWSAERATREWGILVWLNCSSESISVLIFGLYFEVFGSECVFGLVGCYGLDAWAGQIALIGLCGVEYVNLGVAVYARAVVYPICSELETLEVESLSIRTCQRTRDRTHEVVRQEYSLES